MAPRGSTPAPSNEILADDPHDHGVSTMSWQYASEVYKQRRAAQLDSEAPYFDMLADVDARHKFFAALTHPEEGDHSEVLSVKSKISELV